MVWMRPRRGRPGTERLSTASGRPGARSTMARHRPGDGGQRVATQPGLPQVPGTGAGQARQGGRAETDGRGMRRIAAPFQVGGSPGRQTVGGQAQIGRSVGQASRSSTPRAAAGRAATKRGVRAQAATQTGGTREDRSSAPLEDGLCRSDRHADQGSKSRSERPEAGRPTKSRVRSVTACR